MQERGQLVSYCSVEKSDLVRLCHAIATFSLGCGPAERRRASSEQASGQRAAGDEDRQTTWVTRVGAGTLSIKHYKTLL